MRVFTVSDIHIDYDENKKWLDSLSKFDFRDDILILAGDITDNINLFEYALSEFKLRFKEIIFVPGNHDLWIRNNTFRSSKDKLTKINQLCKEHNIITDPYHSNYLSIIPLYGWYDYSFGEPTNELLNKWVDYRACKWSKNDSEEEVTNYFLSLNKKNLDIKNDLIITFSHFLPRIDLMPSYIPADNKILYPVLGCSMLEKQIRTINPDIHIYGHSHLNRRKTKQNITYINNAFGYPHEQHITAKDLYCVYES